MIPSLSGVHFLITYGCSAECDHCFIWGAPGRRSAMAPKQIDDFLGQVASLETVTGVCGEGGESFTEYSLLLQFLRRATALGLAAGALTNASWATSRAKAEEGIAELMAAGLTNLGVSTDQYHQRSVPVERVDVLLAVCQEAGLAAARMETPPDGVMYRGRAAERLAPSRPTRPSEELASCPHERLGAPSRVHLDCYGFLHLCQGLTLGRLPIADAVGGYDPESHPIVRLLLNGGPQGVSAPPLPRSSRPGRDVRRVRASIRTACAPQSRPLALRNQDRLRSAVKTACAPQSEPPLYQQRPGPAVLIAVLRAAALLRPNRSFPPLSSWNFGPLRIV